MSGWWSGHKMVDPTDLEARFSNEDSMAYMDAVVQDVVSDEGMALIERVKGVMDLLPPREADFIDLYYFKRVKQTDIALMFGVSQPTVCYRLQRAAARIQFLMSLPDLTPDEVRVMVGTVVLDPVDVEIMVIMLNTTCQSEVAKQLHVTQGFVRHRFLRTLAKMRVRDDLAVLVDTFDRISTNLNILREVQRPSWDARVHIVA